MHTLEYKEDKRALNLLQFDGSGGEMISGKAALGRMLAAVQFRVRK